MRQAKQTRTNIYPSLMMRCHTLSRLCIAFEWEMNCRNNTHQIKYWVYEKATDDWRLRPVFRIQSKHCKKTKLQERFETRLPVMASERYLRHKHFQTPAENAMTLTPEERKEHFSSRKKTYRGRWWRCRGKSIDAGVAQCSNNKKSSSREDHCYYKMQTEYDKESEVPAIVWMMGWWAGILWPVNITGVRVQQYVFVPKKSDDVWWVICSW